MIFERKIEAKIKKYLFQGDVIVIYGARQVGKTVLVKKMLEEYGKNGKYINCELEQNRLALGTTNSEKLRMFLGKQRIIVLDGAQKVDNVGSVLKILVDEFPETQIIATGSSSFELARGISEPLTGRTKTFLLLPLSVEEIRGRSTLIEVEARLEGLLRFGSYPKVLGKTNEEARFELEELGSKYLFRDTLEFEGIKKSALVTRLLQLLALQIGGEVSFEEIATKLGINRLTVMKYIDVLEQAFVIFKLNSFSRNFRDEVSKSVKIYFWDLGVRNYLIQSFNELELRDDVGRLWENFCIGERMKFNKNNLNFANSYFWRTYGQKEIDYVEEAGGKLTGFEFKWGADKWRVPGSFLETYGGSRVEVVNRDNWWEFVGG